MLKSAEVAYGALLNVLGGEDILRLMIDADEFAPVYATNQGLKFTFRSGVERELRSVQFVPMAVPAGANGEYTYTYEYQLRMIVQSLIANNWRLVKPYHCVDMMSLDNMVRTFSTVTRLTLSFP